jgi:hypothetical protein
MQIRRLVFDAESQKFCDFHLYFPLNFSAWIKGICTTPRGAATVRQDTLALHCGLYEFYCAILG